MIWLSSIGTIIRLLSLVGLIALLCGNGPIAGGCLLLALITAWLFIGSKR